MNGPVRAIAGIKESNGYQRRVARSRKNAARPLSWRPLLKLSGDLGEAKCLVVPKISLTRLRSADAGTGTSPGACND